MVSKKLLLLVLEEHKTKNKMNMSNNDSTFSSNQTFLADEPWSLTFNLISSSVSIILSIVSLVILLTYLKKLHAIIHGIFLSMFIQQVSLYSMILGGQIAMGFFEIQNRITCGIVIQGTLMISLVSRTSVAAVSISRYNNLSINILIR